MHFLDTYLLRLHRYCTSFVVNRSHFVGDVPRLVYSYVEDFPSGIPLHELSHALLIIIA